MRFLSLLSFIAVLVTPALTQDQIPPGVAFLYNANITVGLSVDVGAIPAGNVTVIPVIGGALIGPQISGTSLSLSVSLSVSLSLFLFVFAVQAGTVHLR